METENKVIDLGDGRWVSDGALKAYELFKERQQKILGIFLLNPDAWKLRNARIEKNTDNRKWAWVRVGNTRKMCWVDNVTMKAYKADGYSKTWIEIPRFTFERWATTFDL